MDMDLMSAFGNVLYGGIDPEIPGHGGEECTKYLDRKLMVLDTSIATAIMIGVFIFAMKTYSFPVLKGKPADPVSKQVLLVFMCLVFGTEIGYKICSRQLLYLLNPCHIITIVELYLLASKQSPRSMAVLRYSLKVRGNEEYCEALLWKLIKLSTTNILALITVVTVVPFNLICQEYCPLIPSLLYSRLLIHYLYGALIAMLLPDTMARQFPGEIGLYWIQHVMIFFIIPPYLVYIYGIESLEPMKEWAWSCFSGIFFGIHHLYILQPVGILSDVNLNFVLCPSTKDPFNGPYYRLAAVFHQALCLLTLGKIYSLLLHLFIPSTKKRNKTS